MGRLGDRLRPVSKRTVPKVLRRVTGTIFEEMPQGVGSRQVYWEPQLDLFVENVDLLREIRQAGCHSVLRSLTRYCMDQVGAVGGT